MKTGKTKPLSANMEDYLEAIAILKKENKVARVKDISRFLNVKYPSVTAAIDGLSKAGFVIHERYGYVDLTEEGELLARICKDKHELMTKFLRDVLNVDAKVAQRDACKLEHSMSAETSEKLNRFISKYKRKFK